MAFLKKTLRRFLTVAAIVLAGVTAVLAVALALVWLDKPLVLSMILPRLEQRTGAKIRVERLDYGFFPLTLNAHGIGLTVNGGWGEANLSFKRLGMDGNLKRLIKGIKPQIGGVKIEGGDIRIRLNRSEGKSDPDAILQQVFSSLSQIGKIDVKDIQASFFFRGLEFGMDVKEFSFVDRGEGDSLISFRASDFRIRQEGAEDIWRGPLRASLNLAYDGNVRWDGTFWAGTSKIALLGRTADLPETGLKAAGSFSPKDRALFISPFEIECPGLIKTSGNISSKLGPPLSLNVEAGIDVKDPARLLELLKPHVPETLRSISLLDKPVVKGTAVLKIGPQTEGRPSFESTIELGGVRLSYPFQNSQLTGSGSLQITCRGMPLEARISGAIRVSLPEWRKAGLRLSGLEAQFPIEGDLNSWTIPRATLTMKKISLQMAPKPIALDDILITSGRARLNRETLALSSFEARVVGLGTLRGSANLSAGPKGGMSISLKSSKIDLSLIRARLSSFVPASLAAWTIGGETELGIDISRASGASPWSFSGSASISHANFQNASSTIAGDGLEVSFAFRGDLNPSQKPWQISGACDIKRGEVLWKDLYIDWSRSPLSSEFSCLWDGSTRTIELLSSRIALVSVGEMKSAGTIAGTSPYPFRLNTTGSFDLRGLAAWASSLRNTKPSTSIEGTGQADITISSQNSALSFKGRVDVRNVKIENVAAGLSISGLEAILPFWFDDDKEPNRGEETRIESPGRIRAEELRTPWFAVRPFEVGLSSGKNRFQIQPLRFPLSGGMIKIGASTVTFDSAKRSLGGDSSLRLEDIDLARLPKDTVSIPIKGSFRAAFPSIHFTPQRITTGGEGDLTIFGGRMKVRNVSVLNPFSAGRTFRCDAEFDEMDLEQLTDVVPFGRVTGTLRGEVTGFALTYGQPESFSLRFESVKKKGVSQKFSLRAVNNLSIISSGEKTSLVPSRWWLRFVSHFRYSKIGIASTLRNDMFTLRGTIVENGVEYLVKKTKWFGINVINKMPDKTISFKDMAQRLKRVG